MKITAIDFSINCPGFVTFDTETKIFKPFAIRRNGPKKVSEFTKSLLVACEKFENPFEDQEHFLNLITELLEDSSIIILEGYSYSSFSSSYIQLIEYQSILRNKLFNKSKKLFVFAPTEIKKTAGKGNFSKFQMFESFIELNPDEFNFEIPFLKYCIDNKEILLKKSGVAKPYEDIIDAFFGLLTFFKTEKI